MLLYEPQVKIINYLRFVCNRGIVFICAAGKEVRYGCGVSNPGAR